MVLPGFLLDPQTHASSKSQSGIASIKNIGGVIQYLGMMLCFHCADDYISAIRSCFITEGSVNEYKPIFSVSSCSPMLGEDNVLLRSFARSQQQFLVLLPAAHATTGKSICLSGVRVRGSTSNWLLWDQNYQRFLNRGGEEVSSAFSLIHLKLPAALEGVEATEKVAAKPSFQLLKCQRQGAGVREAHWAAWLCKVLL